MRLTFLIGIVYLAILKATNFSHRSPAPRAVVSRPLRAGIVWGSLVAHNGDPS